VKLVSRVYVRFHDGQTVHREGAVDHGFEGFLRISSTPRFRVQDEPNFREPVQSGLTDHLTILLDHKVFAFLRIDRHHRSKPRFSLC
jgi:hypothetical protein